MSIKQEQEFDPLAFPLIGTRLIEASAGSGKTHTLIIFYLRLLLGLHHNEYYIRPLNVKEILVVTFTNSATNELRNRIHKNIYLLRMACMHGCDIGSFQEFFLSKIENIELAFRQLSIAEQQIHKASIFTIHSFCKRILTKYTIYSNESFKENIVENASLLYKKIYDNFLQKNLCYLPINIVNMMKIHHLNPKELFFEILPYLSRITSPKVFNYSDKNKNIIICYNNIISCVNEIKNKFIQEKNTLQQIIDIFYLQNHHTHDFQNILSYFKKICMWSESKNEIYSVPKELEILKNVFFKNYLSCKDELKIYSLFKMLRKYNNLIFLFREIIFSKTLKNVRSMLDEEKRLKSILEFNDFLKNLIIELHSSNGLKLEKIIRIQHPIVMIDEFQDIDPKQYYIFQRVYNKQQKCGLIFIGDPKQSIYSFRGANIFTCINTKNEVDSYHTLKYNWRSSSRIVNAINQLFQCSKKPFIFNEFIYFPSKTKVSSPNAQSFFMVNKKIQPAMCLLLQNDPKVKKNELKEMISKKCAKIIQDWLQSAKNKNAWIENKNIKKRLLKISDITILVRNYKESFLMHKSLEKLEIPSVILYNYKNVFHTEEACELLWCLNAILFPYNEQMLRCALSTNLMCFQAQEIDEMNVHPERIRNMFEKFSSLYIFWKNYGILSMIKKMITSYNIKKKII